MAIQVHPLYYNAELSAGYMHLQHLLDLDGLSEVGRTVPVFFSNTTYMWLFLSFCHLIRFEPGTRYMVSLPILKLREKHDPESS